MSTGWMALAAALLAGAPAADDAMPYKQNHFTIPIKVKPERMSEIRELLLYVSRDQGKTWGISGRVTPDKKGLEFYGDGDGLYYFSIAVIDRNGRQDPIDVYRAPIGMKILIDTKKPSLTLAAERTAGSTEVQLTYTMQEDRPDAESLRLEYRPADAASAPWTPLPAQFGERGSHRFDPHFTGPVAVRLSLRDKAGNEAVEEKTVPGSTMRMDQSLVLTNGGGPTPNNTNPPPPSPTPSNPEPANRTNSAPLATAAQSPPPTNDANTAAPPITASQGGPTRGSLPPLQIVKQRQVKLGFNVTRFGPSGLGSVDVYVTTDEGATWEKSQADPNVTLPVTPETRGSQPVRGNVTVNLTKDGVIYGFHLVVKSRAGLGKEPPRAGDPPHVRIELDTMQPEAELYAPLPDPAHPDCLALTWKATDRNLAANPVSLEWAARPEGPWSFIGEAQLANAGRYLWHVPDNTPAKVYLRLSVRDTAGNTAVAQTSQPVAIDLIKPEVGDVGVTK